jgi:hypothetical protein
MSLQMRQLLAIHCVTSSLALVTLGSSDMTSGFCLRTLSFGRPHAHRGTCFGYCAYGAQSLCLLDYYTTGL